MKVETITALLGRPFVFVLRCSKIKKGPFEALWERVESNHRHKDFQSFALPTELHSRLSGCKVIRFCQLNKQYLQKF